MLLDRPGEDFSLTMPPILEDMAYVSLTEPFDLISQPPRSLKTSQSNFLASRAIQATQYRASRSWESSERRGMTSARPQPSLSAPCCVQEIPLQGDAASSEPSEDDAEHPWYHGSSPEDLATFRESFIHDVELWRMQKCWYTPAPRMPSMLNPVRKGAPPLSWIHLENPYPSCRAWKMTSSILDRRERSR